MGKAIELPKFSNKLSLKGSGGVRKLRKVSRDNHSENI